MTVETQLAASQTWNHTGQWGARGKSEAQESRGETRHKTSIGIQCRAWGQDHETSFCWNSLPDSRIAGVIGCADSFNTDLVIDTTFLIGAGFCAIFLA